MTMREAGSPQHLWFIFHESRLLLTTHNDEFYLPESHSLDVHKLELSSSHEIGEVDGMRCFAAVIANSHELPERFEFVGLRESFGLLEDRYFGMAGRAFQILEWERNHKFCGRCGARTEHLDGEWARKCEQCNLPSYPRLSPAVIMRITRADRLLLTHASHHPEGLFTVPAGFVEPGETLEEAVAREVKEEVGIDVKNVKYFGSQPWPFPHQLMIGFTAEHASGEINVDGDEIVEAMWCRADEMPQIPSRVSISRALIDSFINQYKQFD